MASFLSIVKSYGISKPRRVLHIGANYGQEAKLYSELGIEAWHVEAIPNVFSVMKMNTHSFENQHPICACLSAEEGKTVSFNIASNNGASSSILDLGRHEYAHPSVRYVDTITLSTRTVDGLIANGEVPADLDFIVIDVQGAEMLILEGSRRLLATGKLSGAFIETAVDPLYANGADYLDVGKFLKPYDLHLCQAIFNSKGWTDALYSRPYWPRGLPVIEVTGKNIAPLATVSQSSVYGANGKIDSFTGVRTGGFSFHTHCDKNAWVRLSFPSEQLFHEILIFNRLEVAESRSKNISILSSLDGELWEVIHEHYMPFGGIDGNPLRIKCPGTRATHIQIRLRDKNYLHLDQIEVYA